MFSSVVLGMTIANALPNVAILVHGAGGGGWEYDKWRPLLQKAGYQVIAKDLMPAKGGLAKTTFEDYVQQVKAWIPKQRGRLVFVGASMGGAIVLRVAEDVKPDELVLVNSVIPKGYGPAREPREIPDVVRWANGPLKETRDAMPDSDEKTILWAWKRWRDESGEVIATLSAGVEVEKPSCPILSIISEKDTDVPPDFSLTVAKAYGADVHWYRGMSHVGPLMSTRAEEVCTALIGWLKSRKR